MTKPAGAAHIPSEEFSEDATLSSVIRVTELLFVCGSSESAGQMRTSLRDAGLESESEERGGRWPVSWDKWWKEPVFRC